MDMSYFCFVYVATENQVAHIGYSSDGRTVIECVTHDNRVSYLDRYVQYQTVDGRTDKSAAERSTVFGDTFFYNLQIIFGCLNLFTCLTGSQQCLFVFLVAYQLIVVKLFHTCQVGFCLTSVHFCQADTAFGRVQLSQFGDNLYFGYDFTFLYFLARFFVYFGNDTRNLRLDLYLVARFNLSRCYGSLYQIGGFYFLNVVLRVFRL